MPTSVEVTGDNQTGTVGMPLSDTVRLRVLDQDGAPVQGRVVDWVLTGGGRVDPQAGVTDEEGSTGVAWTLGTTAGVQELKASVRRTDLTADISATALPGPASRVVLTPDTVIFHSLQDSALIQASVTDAHGNAVTDAITWSTKNPAVAAVTADGWIRAEKNGTTTVSAAAGSASRNVVVIVSQQPAALYISPTTDTLESIGDTILLAAQIQDAGGNEVAGVSATWTSLATGILSVDTAGQVIALRNGSGKIEATAGSVADTVDMAVVQRPAALAISPGSDTLPIADTVSFQARLADAKGVAIDGATYHWSSTDTTVAVVLSADSTARVEGKSSGSTGIVVTAADFTDTAHVRVYGETAEVTISPATDTAAPGDTVRFSALARDLAGDSLPDVAFTWTSTDTTVATVDSTGLAEALSTGSTRIIAADTGMADTADFVVAVQVAAVDIGPDDYTLTWIGQTHQLRARALTAGGQEIPDVVFTWASSDTTVVSVDSTGMITAESNGTTRIAAAAEGRADTIDIVVAQSPDSAEVEPAAATLTVIGDTVHLTGLAFDLGGAGIPDLTLTWLSRDTTVATVDADGVATAVGNGVAWIVGNAGAAADSTELEVAVPLATVEIEPAGDSLTWIGETRRFSAHALAADDQKIPGVAFTWTSNDVAVATVDSLGLVTAVSSGTARIAAAAEGGADTVDIVVEQAPDSVRITPAVDTTRVLGDTVRFSARVFDHGGTEIAGSSFAWASTDEGVATIDGAGVATSVANGVASIVATSGAAADTAELVVAVPTALTLGQPVPDLSGASASERAFLLTLPAAEAPALERGRDPESLRATLAESEGAGILLRVRISGGSGNADLYVRHGSRATTSSYDCKPSLTGNDEVCEFPSPATGDWHIMLRGVSAFSGVTLLAETEAMNAEPVPEITAPSDSADLAEGAEILFQGSATDPEDGPLTGASLVWTSSLDGEIGTGASFTRSDLSVGTHTVTLTATDSRGASGAVSVEATVGPLRLTLGEPVTDLNGAEDNLQFFVLTLSEAEALRLESRGGASGPVVAGGLGQPKASPLRDPEAPPLSRVEASGGSVRVLRFHITGGTGDADLYVRHGSRPSFSTFACRPYLTGNEETCEISSAAAGDWYVMVHAYEAFSGLTLLAETEMVNAEPVAEITAPSDESALEQGSEILFQGTGVDAEDGELTGSSLVWTSSLDGEIGTGTSFTRSDLSIGAHTVTLTATDASGATGTASIAITIESAGALNLYVEAVHLNQGNQTRQGTIGGIALRPGLLRVLVAANKTNSAEPAVRVRLYQGGTLLREQTLTAPRAGVPLTPDLRDANDTYDLALSASEVVAGLAVEVLVDPDNAIMESDEGDNGFPALGTADLDVQAIPDFNVVFIPIEATVHGTTGNVNAANAGDFLEATGQWIPTSRIASRIHATFTTAEDLSTSAGWSNLLSDIQAVRTLEAAADEYYHGIIGAFTGMANAGIGYRPSVASSTLRSAVSHDNLPYAAGTVAHEFGHNLGRMHTPCGGPANVDPDYPHPDAEIGPPGYDIDGSMLVTASNYRDYMSYCGPEWTSDYTYEGILGWRREDPLASSSDKTTAALASQSTGLLIWGRIHAGEATLNPAFALTSAPALPREAGPNVLRALAAGGTEVFRFSFRGVPVADAADTEERHFSYFVPLTAVQLQAVERIELSTPRAAASRVSATASIRGVPGVDAAPPPVRMDAVGRGRTRLRWDSERYPMLMVRDPVTGEVLALLRGGDAELDRGTLPIDRMQFLVSDGVRSRLAPRQ